MKNIVWFLISLVFHISLAGSLLFTQKQSPNEAQTEIFDLTLHPVLEKPYTATSRAAVGKKVSLAKAESISNSTTSTLEPENENSESSTEGDLNASLVGLKELSRLPRVKKEIKALYPEEAKQARIDGSVVLDVIIGKEGKVQDVTLVRGPGHGLNESALNALKQFEFAPALQGATPVAVKIRYTYKFKLGVN